ncbi:MAG: hypothetical protein LBO82_04565 [Synergistaceae bacterium]|jgi:hypothetical protein|nr:hypothetical protein [Synergistaceae bacterium]
MNASSPEFKKLWKEPVVRLGVITVLVPTALCFLPCAYLYIVHGVAPTFDEALKAWGMIATIFGAFYIVEPISYYPILGLTGTYISFLAGNISNVRIPSAAVAQDVAGTETGTLEAEIVATLGVAGSVVTNLFFVSLAAVAGAYILSLLPPSVQNAFKNYTVPAIFGAVFCQFGMKAPILILFAAAIPFLMLYVAPLYGLTFLSAAWLVIVASVFGTIAIARILFKMGKLG